MWDNDDNDQDSWFGFKRVRTTSTTTNTSTSTSTVSKTTATRVQNDKDPHLCLECGKEISRGREFYKKRHWENSHRGDLTFRYKTMIVPINHEKACALLKKKTQKQTSKSLTTASTPQAVHDFPSGINKELVTIHNVNDDNSDENKIDSNDVIENNPQHSMDVQLENSNSQNSDKAFTSMQSGTTGSQVSDSLNDVCKARNIQSTSSSFMTAENRTVTPTMEEIQSGINQILVKMESFSRNGRHGVEANMQDMLNNDTTSLKAANNLKEVCHPDIKVGTIGVPLHVFHAVNMQCLI